MIGCSVEGVIKDQRNYQQLVYVLYSQFSCKDHNFYAKWEFVYIQFEMKNAKVYA